MIPFDPWSSSTLAYQRWQRCINFAKGTKHPANISFFSTQAAKAQAVYVMCMAIDKVHYYKSKPNDL